MGNKLKIVMIGGCKEQFEQFRCYPLLDVIVIASGDDLIDAQSEGLRCYQAEPINTQDCLDIVLKNELSVNLFAIFSFTEFGIETASYIGEVLGVLCNPLKPVVQTRNKHLMRQILSNSCPELTSPYLVSGDITEIRAFIQKHGLVIIKPVDGAGSKEVRLVSKDSCLVELTDKITKCICEKFIGGTEYSVESFSAYEKHRVVAITEKTTTENAPFVELTHLIPANMENDLFNLISDKIIAFLEEIGQVHGPAHTEIKIMGDQVFVIESQTRLGGDRIWKLVELATGFNFIQAFIEEVLLRQKYKSPQINKHAGIKFFAPRPGRLKTITIPSKLDSLSSIIDIQVTTKVGDIVPALSSSNDRSGFAILLSESRQDMMTLFRELDQINLETIDVLQS